MNYHGICDSILSDVETLKNENHIEMELRLGKFNGSFFDTNVGKDRFMYFMQGLKKYNGWEKVVSSHTEVFYRESDNLRITVDENSGDQDIITKERVLNKDFQMAHAPYDVRFSISKEIPMDDDYEGEMDKKKTKKRTSFIRKNLSIDMTECTGDSDDMDAEEMTTYQIEFEIINPREVENKDQLFNIIHKIKDLFNILSNIK